jgi:hypothetical protein
MIQVWELDPEQQDSLWIRDICPYCNAKIIEKDLAVDIVWWHCAYCDNQFIVE